MATQVQRRRGTTAQNAAFTGVEGEVTLDTQTHRLITHDGATIGGFILAGLQVANTFSAVQTINVASGALSLPLDIQVDGLSRASINNQGYLSLLRQEADTGISGIDVFKRGTTGNALAAVSASSGIGGFNFRAWQGAAFSGTVAAMRAFAAETFTAAAQGTFIVLSTAQIGTTVLSENVRFQTLASGSFVSFGGTSSSFPALKRSGTQLLLRLADDSADAGFQAGATTLSGLLQFAGTTHAGIRVNNLTTAQRDAIAAPVDGMLIFNSTTSQFEGYDSGWGAISGGGSSPPFADSTALVAGSVDPTKLLRFEVDGLTTATTRVLTPQDADYTIAGLETANIFSVLQVFNSGANFGAGATTIDAAGSYVGPVMEIENQLTVNTGTGQEANVEFRVFNVDTLSVSFGVLGSGALVLADGIRQTFNPDGTTPGLNFGSNAGDPSTPSNGDVWYNSTSNKFRARENGVSVDMIGGGSSPPFTDSTELVAGSADATKLLRFEVDGFTAATTRVLTPQNADYTIAGLETAQTFTALNTMSANGIGTTVTERLQFSNITAATAGIQQFSPALRFTGQGWKTVATAASQPVDVRTYVRPVIGGANPGLDYLIEASINNGAWTAILTMNFTGAAALTTVAGGFNSGAITATGNITIGTTNQFRFGTAGSGRSILSSSADGLIELFNTAQTGFTRLNFGGVTSSFPAITRSGAGFIFNLADGTGSAAITTGNITMTTAALLSITSGTNQRAGNAVLVAGTITVSNTTVTANTIVMLTRKTSGGTIGTAITYTVSAGASFTITSDSVLDTSTFSYMLIEVP